MALPHRAPDKHPLRRRLLLPVGLLLLAAGLGFVWPLAGPRPPSEAPDAPPRAGDAPVPPAASTTGEPGDTSTAGPLLASEPGSPAAEEEEEEELELLEGTVVDDEGRPVDGARLYLSGPPMTKRGPSHLGSTQTGEDGTFTLRWRVPGPHTVFVQHTDFLSTEQPLELPASRARLVLHRGASVEVEVLDESGLPLPGSEVYLHDEYRQVPGQTDASGKALLRVIRPGRHVVVAATTGDEPLRTVRGEVEVRGEERHAVRLRFTPGPLLSGVVVDTAGRPVEGAEVRAAPAALVDSFWEDRVLYPYASRLYREWNSGTPWPCHTGPDGRFTLTHLTPGAWVVTALQDGYTLDARATPGPLRSIGSRQGVLAEAGGGEVRLVLATQPYLSGRVVRADGSPVTRFELEGRVHEDARGAFRLPIREGGEKLLVFTAPGLAGTLRRVQVRQGVGMDLGEVVLEPGRAVLLRVVDAETSEPVKGAPVDVRHPLDPDTRMDRSMLYPYLSSEPLELSDFFRTGEDGTVTLPHVEEQPREVIVLDPDYLLATVPLGARERELTVRLRRGARLVGMTHVGGKVTGDGVAMVLTEEGRRLSHQTIKNGVFSTLPMEAGRYVVRVETLFTPEQEMPSFAARVVELPEGGVVQVHLEAPGQGADLSVRSAGQVGGYLLLPGSWPLPDTRERFLAARNAAHGCMFNMAREAPHPCTFELLPAGRYTLLAVRDWYARPLELHREEVVMPDSGTLSLELQPRWRPGPDVPPER